MQLELAPRINLITGDNGLGKSFLLDVAWWATFGLRQGRSVEAERAIEAAEAFMRNDQDALVEGLTMQSKSGPLDRGGSGEIWPGAWYL